MKLNLLHEATSTGAIADRPIAITGAAVNAYKGNKSANPSKNEIGNKSKDRWYLKFAKTQNANLNG